MSRLRFVDVFDGDLMPQDLPCPGIVHREPITGQRGGFGGPLVCGLRCWYLDSEETP